MGCMRTTTAASYRPATTKKYQLFDFSEWTSPERVTSHRMTAGRPAHSSEFLFLAPPPYDAGIRLNTARLTHFGLAGLPVAVR